MPGGMGVVESKATPIIYEYLERKRLAALGLTSRLDALPAWKVDALLVVDAKAEELRIEAEKKAIARARARI